MILISRVDFKLTWVVHMKYGRSKRKFLTVYSGHYAKSFAYINIMQQQQQQQQQQQHFYLYHKKIKICELLT